MVNTPYYLRPEGNYYRIDVEYIKTAYTKVRNKVGKNILGGALSGMASFGTVDYISNQSSEERLKDALVVSAIGLVIGGIVGTIRGFSSHNKAWPINGSSLALANFRDDNF